jgi:hypothetical protein
MLRHPIAENCSERVLPTHPLVEVKTLVDSVKDLGWQIRDAHPVHVDCDNVRKISQKVGPFALIPPGVTKGATEGRELSHMQIWDVELRSAQHLLPFPLKAAPPNIGGYEPRNY